MKEIIQKKVATVRTPEEKFNALRELLQHLILKILDEEGFFGTLSFIGGTSLRILFDLGRFSEDLDFSLQKAHDPRFESSKMIDRLVHRLSGFGFAVDTKSKEVSAVQGAFLRFREILQETGASQRIGQKLSIKLEVDTNPPLHAGFESRMVNKDFLFMVMHHDLPTLFAGKLLAFLNRNYQKGRDVYDLLWFCGRKTKVNRRFFESGLNQATGKILSWDREGLIRKLTEKIEATDLVTVARDTLPFLDDPKEGRFFEKGILLQAVKAIEYV